MQLRKVCNHPNLFEVRPTISPFQCVGIRLHIPSIMYSALEYNPFKVGMTYLNVIITTYKNGYISIQSFSFRNSVGMLANIIYLYCNKGTRFVQMLIVYFLLAY